MGWCMNIDEFFKLNIGQVIYYEGGDFEINGLSEHEDIKTINLNGKHHNITESDFYNWNNICEECSLEPPKEEKEIKLLAYVWIKNKTAPGPHLAWAHDGDNYYSSEDYNGWKRCPSEDKTVTVQL